MSSAAKFRDGQIGPTLILFLICAILTLAVAAVNGVTAPIIEQVEIEAANETRKIVLPEGDSFTKVVDRKDGEVIAFEGLHENVSEVYVADNETGYVIRSAAKGFDGLVTFMIGMDSDGNITGINMFDHNETPGLGTKVANEDYLANYLGDIDPMAVDSITGATRTSNALKNSLIQAKDAYNIAKEAD